jgi:enoyl-CoA hydratase/carnithine racemase
MRGMTECHARYESEGAVALITLDRPAARNAYSDEMIEDLCHAFDQADADREVRAVVLTGAGPSFSAGGDLKAMRDRSGMFAGGPAQLRSRYIEGIQRIPKRIDAFEKPIIAAVNGAAIGAGLDLACMCDIRVMARGAKLGSTFVKVGLIPGDGGAYFLTRTIGFSRALEMILTGRIVEDEEALRIGLVHHVVEPDMVVERAREIALGLAGLPPRALSLAKRVAYASLAGDLRSALDTAATYQGVAQNASDHVEAVSAMLEKRAPVFTGE